MNPIKTNTITSIDRNNPEAIAKTVGLRDINVSRPEQVPDRRLSVPATIALGGAVVSSALWLAGPRPDDAPKSTDPTLTEYAQESANTPYDPSKDKLVIDNVTLSPENNTPSEAVLGNESVQTYIASNSDEELSLVASATSLPTDYEEYAVVERDIDNDGDTDAVAVPVPEALDDTK